MPLIDFYRNAGPDHAGRTLEDIWSFSYDQLESTHDFIQWLFPIDKPSPVNPLAPTLDAETAAAFRHDPQITSRLLKSLDVMLTFYGLKRVAAAAGVTVQRAPNFPRRAPEWLSPGDHNLRRLTRILRCLHLAGLNPEARALLAALQTIAKEYPAAATGNTLHYWEDALGS